MYVQSSAELPRPGRRGRGVRRGSGCIRTEANLVGRALRRRAATSLRSGPYRELPRRRAGVLGPSRPICRGPNTGARRRRTAFADGDRLPFRGHPLQPGFWGAPSAHLLASPSRGRLSRSRLPPTAPKGTKRGFHPQSPGASRRHSAIRDAPRDTATFTSADAHSPLISSAEHVPTRQSWPPACQRSPPPCDRIASRRRWPRSCSEQWLSHA